MLGPTMVVIENGAVSSQYATTNNKTPNNGKRRNAAVAWSEPYNWTIPALTRYRRGGWTSLCIQGRIVFVVTRARRWSIVLDGARLGCGAGDTDDDGGGDSVGVGGVITLVGRPRPQRRPRRGCFAIRLVEEGLVFVFVAADSNDCW